MKSESIAFGIAGIAFGLIAGWIIGTQQGSSRRLSLRTGGNGIVVAGAGKYACGSS